MDYRSLIASFALLWASSALAASLSLDKGPVVLGRTESVGVTIRIDEVPGTEDRPLQLATNVGSFGPATRTGAGIYRSVFVMPPTRFPQVALVAVWRETGPDARIDFLRIPLYGSTKIPVSTKRGAEVSIEVGPDKFGPVKTDGRGQATLAIDVPPGVREAQITVKEKTGVVSQKRVPIEVPPYNRLTAALVPHAVVADGAQFARLEVFYDLGGADVPADRVQISTSAGTPVLESAEKGRYVYRYVPPAGTGAKDVRFNVRVAQDGAAQASTVLELGLPPPARLVVRPPKERLTADGRSTGKVEVLLFDDTGLGLPAEGLELLANETPIKGVRYLGDGRHEATFTAPASYPAGGLVQFTARLAAKGRTVNAVANYQIEPGVAPKGLTAQLSPSPVPLDGRTEATVTFDVRDGAGLPLHGAKLLAVASHGELGQLEEIENGVYRARYVAPASGPSGETVIKVVDSTGLFEQSVEVPVRENPHRFLIGVRGGLSHSLGNQLLPKAGLDVLVPFRVGGMLLGAGLTASYQSATQTVTDGVLESRSTASWAPVSLRLSYELFATRRLSLSLGAGGVVTFAQLQTSLTGERQRGVGLGGQGFAALSASLGPGVLFVEAGFGAAPIRQGNFRLEAGGVSAELGYRFGVF